MEKRISVMLPLRMPRLDGTKSLRYLPRRVVQAMADHATANLLIGERTVPSRFVVLRLAADEVEREELERQFAESQELILKEVAREARARDFRLRGELSVRLRTFVASGQWAVGSGQSAAEAPAGLVTGESKVETAQRSLDGPGQPTVYCPLPTDLWARLETEREIILPERLRTLLVESRPPGAAVYLDSRQIERVTPCRIPEVPAGAHSVSMALPGFMPHELTVQVPESGEGEIGVSVDLEAEPPMGILEVVTFPSQAMVTVIGAPGAPTAGSRSTPARLRLPAGRVCARIERTEFEPEMIEYDLPAGGESAPGRVQVRLRYAGDDRDDPVGRLIIYKPENGMARRLNLTPQERPEDTIASFFRDQGVETETGSQVAMAADASYVLPEVLGERRLFKGVLLIGRDDRQALVHPDVKLFDPANTVSRGCHAWLHIYSDPGTGAEYNTFVVHNHSPSGILVNGRLVMESAALGDTAELKIGIFRMRVVKETPDPRVEF
jgi:hypothetical protein